MHNCVDLMQHSKYDLREIINALLRKKYLSFGNKTVLSVRGDFVRDDWTSANRHLGQETPILTTSMTVNNHYRF